MVSPACEHGPDGSGSRRFRVVRSVVRGKGSTFNHRILLHFCSGLEGGQNRGLPTFMDSNSSDWFLG
jgi:hypothetical protein